MNYCETCKQEVTNKWTIINGMHVGCPKANEAMQAYEDKILETASEVMSEMEQDNG